VKQENMKSLVKTFDILETFLHGPEELSVTEISKALTLNKTTANRIMLKLVNRGYLKQVEKRGKYSLGTIFLEFSGLIKGRLKIRDTAMPFMLELSRQVKESTILAVWDRKDSVITESFHDSVTNGPLKVVPDEGTSIPLYCTCLGKILLATKSDQEFQEYFKDKRLEPRTRNTLTDFNKIAKQISAVRKLGIAYDDEEYALGVRGVATGIKNNEGKITGAIGILAPSVRISMKEMQKFGPLLSGFAIQISRELGYRDN
jgi:IclR family transcriptional regulator, KDG regulon repressor